MGPHPFLTEGRPMALAHRGGGDLRYENTWRAFAGAIALGYTHLETDVWATADGHLMLFHDDDLQRVADRPGRIGELPYAAVARARVGGEEAVPRLEDVLTTWPAVNLNIDLKADAAVEPFIELVNRLGVQDRICVASFDQRRIRRVAEALDRPACVSAGRTAVARLLTARRRPQNLPDVLQIPPRLGPARLITKRLVDKLHGWGVAVHAWTINEPRQMTELLDLGVDAVISDETEDLRRVLLERGQWV